jgi:hypothetical protein
MEGLFRGTWYRSAVKMERVTKQPKWPWEKKRDVEMIIPTPPFEPYNPFDWYFSASDVRQGERSLYLDFLAVDSDKPQEVLSFCERFGVLGSAESTAEWMEGKGQQRLRAEYAISDLHNMFEGDYDRMMQELIGKPPTTRFPPEILCSEESIYSFKVQQTVLRNTLIPDPAVFSKSSSNQLKEITRSFTNNFLMDSHVQPQLNWNVQENRWELLWVSYDLFGYLFIMLMLDLLGPGKVLSCPRCHTYFMTASNRMKFCSPSCYGVFKVQKYQAKKKELAAQTGKKKATKSTTKKK